jgi:hypothetical protein
VSGSHQGGSFICLELSNVECLPSIAGGLPIIIKGTLSELLKLKQRISKQAQDRFEIRVHNAIPFGSAIIIDGNTGKGRLQIETKPFKAPLRKSFAFEISDHGYNELFATLRDGYLRLMAEGATYESMLESLDHG